MSRALAACGLVGLAMTFPAAARGSAGVTTSVVVVKRAGQVDVPMRCTGARPCRGALVLSVPCDQEDAPVLERDCQATVGRAVFLIRQHGTRIVRVQRNGLRFTSAVPHGASVRASLFVSGHRRASAARRLLLVGAPSLPRPRVRPRLIDLDAFPSGDGADAYELAFEVDGQRGAVAASVAVSARSADLHPAGEKPYVVPGDSWIPGGVAFHGTMTADPRELPPHSRQRVLIATCSIGGCEAAATTLELPGPGDPRPICRTGLGALAAHARLLAGLPQ